MKNEKYTKELLEETAESCCSYMELARKIAGRPVHVSLSHHLKKKCKRLGIDCSHFTGKAHRKGKQANNKLLPDEILVKEKDRVTRRKGSILYRALVEIGRPEKCEECGLETIWNNKPIRLQVDHINGDYQDNTRENLRFLCPNCHSQTNNYGVKNTKKAGGV